MWGDHCASVREWIINLIILYSLLCSFNVYAMEPFFKWSHACRWDGIRSLVQQLLSIRTRWDMVGTLKCTRIRNGNLVIPLKTSDKLQNITQVPTLYIVTWCIFLAVALNCILSAFNDRLFIWKYNYMYISMGHIAGEELLINRQGYLWLNSKQP